MDGRHRSLTKLLSGIVLGLGLLSVIMVISLTLAFTTIDRKVSTSSSTVALTNPSYHSAYPTGQAFSSESISPTPESYSATSKTTGIIFTATAIPPTTKSTLAIEVVTNNPLPPATLTPAPPTPTNNEPTNIRPVSTISLIANQKLSPEEKAQLNHFESDFHNLRASIERVNQLRLQVYPDQQAWSESLQKEVKYWQNLLIGYKSSHLSSRLETQLLPNWLAALAWLDRGGQLLLTGHRQADGIKVSQGDEQVAYAEVALDKVGELLVSLKKL